MEKTIYLKRASFLFSCIHPSLVNSRTFLNPQFVDIIWVMGYRKFNLFKQLSVPFNHENVVVNSKSLMCNWCQGYEHLRGEKHLLLQAMYNHNCHKSHNKIADIHNEISSYHSTELFSDLRCRFLQVTFSVYSILQCSL